MYVDQGKFDPRLKGYLTPDGFKLEIVATEPAVVNPVGMTFGPDGTLYVMEWATDPVTQGRWFEFKETFRYRDGSTKQVATMKKFVADLVKVLRPNLITGKYDRAEPIIADELPSTIVYHDGWLYTASRGTVRRYRQSRPGGPWDVREIIAQGFCGFHHHQVSGLTFGNDGKLYITSGDDDNFAEGSDGSRATILRTGAVFRCNPDGSQMEAYSLGYRNPYRDLAFDDKFNFFHADNDNEDGSKFTGCRLVHVADGIDYGWRLKQGARCCQPDFTRGAIAGELPGKVAPMLKTGRGSPAGLLIYNDTRLPEQYRGLLYYPDVFRKLVRAYKVGPTGATFAVTHEMEFISSTDPLFRPCQMVTGPDGAVYICDWRTDSGGAGRLSGDGIHGRIYRLTWAGTKDQPALPVRGMDSWAKITGSADEDLVSKLAAPDFSDRLVARDELIRRGVKARGLVLSKVVSGTLPPAGRLPALGVLAAIWNHDVEDLFRLLLNDESADARRLAADALGQHAKPGDLETHDALARLLGDHSPAVRRAAALALARVGNEGAADALVNAWKEDDGKDAFLTDAYLRGFERLGKRGIDALIAVAESGSHADRDRVAVAFTGLRTKAAAEALLQLIANPHLLPGQRADLVRSYANYLFDPPLSFEPLAVFLTGRPAEAPAVKVAALDVLASTGNLVGKNATGYALGQLDASDPDVREAAIRAVELTRLNAGLPKLLTMLADAKRAPAERAAILRAVRVTGDRSAVAPLQDLLAKPEPAPFKAEVLRSLAGVDAAAARAAAVKLLDQPDPTLLAETVAVLGATKDGAKLIGERFVARKLPRELWPRVSEALKKFPGDPALAKLNAEVTKGGLLLSNNPVELQKIRDLVMTKGDPKKGKELYLNTTVLACATCHRMEGVGGAVGPDLTRVWDTQTIDKLLESIVQPSKEIKEGYQAYRVNTVDGQVLTGLKVSESSSEVVIRDATGRDLRLAKADIESLAVSKVSLMPDDVISQLSYDQFIDLLAFLKSRPTQESLRGAVLEFAVATGFDPDLTKPQAPEQVAAGKVADAGWLAKGVDPGGLLQLGPLLPGGGKPSAAYALTYVYSPKPQRAAAVLVADDPVRLWVGKTVSFERTAAKPKGQAAADEKFVIELPGGWTPVLAKLSATGPAHRLGLTLVGDGLRAAVKPEK
jgi:putative membrane-bound dehydrogenase-like protein